MFISVPCVHATSSNHKLLWQNNLELSIKHVCTCFSDYKNHWSLPHCKLGAYRTPWARVPRWGWIENLPLSYQAGKIIICHNSCQACALIHRLRKDITIERSRLLIIVQEASVTMGQGRATSMTLMSASKEKRWSLQTLHVHEGKYQVSSKYFTPSFIVNCSLKNPQHAQVHVGLNGGALCDSKDACLDRCDQDHDGVSFVSFW